MASAVDNTSYRSSDVVEPLRQAQDNRELLTMNSRLDVLQAILNALVEHEQRLLDALHEDGKCKAEGTMEFRATLTEVASVARQFKSWCKPRAVSDSARAPAAKVTSKPAARGVIAVVPFWTHPLLHAIVPLAAAVAGGNCVVLCLMHLSANMRAAIHNMVSDRLSRSVVAVIHSAAQLSESCPSVNLVWSSVSTNQFEAAIARVPQRQLTIRSNKVLPCPVVVDNEGLIATASKRILHAKFVNAGQHALAPTCIITLPHLKDKLIKQLRRDMHDMFTHNPQFSADYGRLISHELFMSIKMALIDETDVIRTFMVVNTKSGTMDSMDTSRADSQRPARGVVLEGGAWNDNRYISPTLVDVQDADSELLNTVLLGPVLPIVALPAEEVAEFLTDRLPFSMVYLFTKSQKLINSIAEALPSTLMMVNDTVHPYRAVSEHLSQALTFAYPNINVLFQQFTQPVPLLRHSVGWLARRLELRYRYPPYSSSGLGWAAWAYGWTSSGSLWSPSTTRTTFVSMLTAAAAVTAVVLRKRDVDVVDYLPSWTALTVSIPKAWAWLLTSKTSLIQHVRSSR
ncbi:hypothetical protein RI367_004196 [Sorochytrium milnesiophthora]